MLKIFTVANNRPDFIQLQNHSFLKHLATRFQFWVFNNAQFSGNGPAMADEIDRVCKMNSLAHTRVEKDKELIDELQAIEKSCSLFNTQGNYTNANVAAAYPICWAWKHVIGKQRNPILFLHSDMFLVEPTDFSCYLEDFNACFVAQSRPHPTEVIEYAWDAFFLADLSKLPQPETLNWYCGQIDGVPVDVGGQTHHYFKAHPELHLYKMHQSHVGDNGTPLSNYDEFHLGNTTVLHYRTGSNWNHKDPDYHRAKTAWLQGRI